MRVAIIGAGAAGLCCARHFSRKRYQFSVLERDDQVGGTWVYPSKHTSIYKNLVTNIPKEIMGFPDYPLPSKLPSFVGHRDVLKYLQSYADRFDIRKHIRFQCHVEHIDPISAIAAEKGSSVGSTKWKIRLHDLVTGGKMSEEFDAVLICNGHYSKPHMPAIPGSEFFGGSIVHSNSYREPEAYAGQDILLIGAGYSGTDIVLDLSPHCRKVYISNRGQHISCPLPHNLIEMPDISRIKEDGKVVFLNGKELLIHSIIMTTGYRYSFPFLPPEAGIEVVHPNRVTPVYKHTFNPLHPTMAFVGLPFDLIPFPFFDYQVRWIESVWSGRCCLPDRASMIRDEEETYLSRLEQGLIPRMASHWLGEDQWEFIEYFSKSFGGEMLPPMYQEIDEYVTKQRGINLVGYKKMSYYVSDSYLWNVEGEKD